MCDKIEDSGEVIYSSLENYSFDALNSFSSEILTQKDNVFQDNENILEENINKLLSNLEEFTSILYQMELFEEEFHKSMSMKRIFTYILRDIELNIDYIDFLCGFLKTFYDMFNYKLEHKRKIFSDKNCEKEYMKFVMEFHDKQRFFYVHIYKKSGIINDEFIEKMINLLVEK